MHKIIVQLRAHVELALALVLAVGLWAVHCSDSLWLDELQTTWVIQGTFKNLIERVFDTQGFTPLYYSLIWAMKALILEHEYLFRLPSLILGLLAILGLCACAQRIMSLQGAFLAAMVFAGMDEVVEASLNARPYALALACSVLSLFFLMRWVSGGRRVDQYLYVVTLLMSVYAHYFFVGVVPLHLAFVFLKRKVSQVNWTQGVSTLFYLFIGLFPLIPQLRLMMAKRQVMAIASMPTEFDLILGILPWISLLPIIIAFFASMSCVKQEERIFRRKRKVEWGILAWLIAYCCLPMLALFLFSKLLGTSVFVARYYLWFAPGFALLCGYLSEFIQHTRMREVLILAIALLTYSAEFTKERFHEDWRSAIGSVNVQVARSESNQVKPAFLMYSGVVESARLEWLVLEIKQGQFSAPLSYYKTTISPTLLPLLVMDNLGADGYWQTSILPAIQDRTEVIFLCLDNLSWRENDQRKRVCQAIDYELQNRGFQRVVEERFKRVSVAHYRKIAVQNPEDISGLY